TWCLCKSRSSETDWAFRCKSDFSRCTTHAPAGWPEVTPGMVAPEGGYNSPYIDVSKYGCMAYRGTDVANANVDAFLDKYRAAGKTDVPPDELDQVLRGTVSEPMKPSAN